MDRLSETEQTELRKNSTDRLKQIVAKEGKISAEAIEAMDRAAWLNAVAELQLSSGAKTGVKGATSKPEMEFLQRERVLLEMQHAMLQAAAKKGNSKKKISRRIGCYWKLD